MLQITIPEVERYDEINNTFIITKEQTVQLEHSLVSLSKWESKWCKPFLNKDTKTMEETIDYIRCMTISQNINPEIYLSLTTDNLKQVKDYIDAPMTATTFYEEKKAGGREVITSELLYYWLIALSIPFECQKWHLNRLITLIKICNIKNTPPEKMSKQSILSRNAALNNARKKKMHTNG